MPDTRQQKAALVFGGSRGIGAAAVSRLVEDGFAVAFTYATSADRAKTLIEGLTAQGGHALAIKADSADHGAIKSAVMQAVERLGTLDTVVVNAGILKLGLVEDVSVEELDEMISINFRAVFLSIQSAVPHMKEGGRIITIGSNTAIRTGHAGSSVYQATKAAVAGLVKGLALDLAPRHITVNNVQPGPTATEIHVSLSAEDTSGFTPLKRIAQPAEIAGLISYLARSESGYMTGSSLTIDGGYVL